MIFADETLPKQGSTPNCRFFFEIIDRDQDTLVLTSLPDL